MRYYWLCYFCLTMGVCNEVPTVESGNFDQARCPRWESDKDQQNCDCSLLRQFVIDPSDRVLYVPRIWLALTLVQEHLYFSSVDIPLPLVYHKHRCNHDNSLRFACDLPHNVKSFSNFEQVIISAALVADFVWDNNHFDLHLADIARSPQHYPSVYKLDVYWVHHGASHSLHRVDHRHIWATEEFSMHGVVQLKRSTSFWNKSAIDSQRICNDRNAIFNKFVQWQSKRKQWNDTGDSGATWKLYPKQSVWLHRALVSHGSLSKPKLKA